MIIGVIFKSFESLFFSFFKASSKDKLSCFPLATCVNAEIALSVGFLNIIIILISSPKYFLIFFIAVL